MNIVEHAPVRYLKLVPHAPAVSPCDAGADNGIARSSEELTLLQFEMLSWNVIDLEILWERPHDAKLAVFGRVPECKGNRVGHPTFLLDFLVKLERNVLDRAIHEIDRVEDQLHGASLGPQD